MDCAVFTGPIDSRATGTKLDTARPSLPPEAVVSPLPESPAFPHIILVVEDEDVVRQMLTRVLGNAGYRTLEARHGEEALQMVTFAYPYLNLVITDVLMPKLDGRGLGHRLRERWPELPVLYISGYPASDVFHPEEASSLVPFLQKPLHTEELVALVGRLLADRSTSAPSPPLDSRLTRAR
jgi:two-component system, cell cycle sensor histidine kinase and response regulator CckA